MKAFETRVRLMALMVLICCLAFSTQSAKAQQTISFPDFSSTTGLQPNGDAVVTSNNVLRLTPAAGSQDGTTWYANSLSLKQGFSTTFTFRFTTGTNGAVGIGAADGIAFVIQNGSFPNGKSGALAVDPSASGGGIGFQGLTHSLAIEFDIFCNPTNSDTCASNSFSSDNEVGILSCGANPNSAIHTVCGISAANPTTSILADGTAHTAVITYTPPCDGCKNLTVALDNNQILTVAFDIATLGLDSNDTAFVGFTAATGGGFENQDILSWNFTATQSQQTGSTISSNTPATLAQQFVFNNTANKHVEFDFDYNPAFNASTLTILPNTVPRVSDDAVTQSDYQTMVKGTALAETQCFTSNGQLDGLGNAACPKLTIQCTTDGTNFAGDTCPQSTARNLLFKHIIDVIGGPSLDATHNPIILPGSAPTLAMGSDNWSPTNGCTLEGPEAGQLCPKSIGVPFTDCCTGGGTTKGSNSGFIAGCCEREWTTMPTIALWSNSTTVPVSFTSNPPSVPSPNPNNWVAAPGQSVTFGFEAPGAAPDPTFPIAGDQTVLNPTPPSGNMSAPCGSSMTSLNWGTPGVNPPGFNTSGSVMVGGEGAYELHFFSTDCDDMEELVYAPNGANNWAKFKTTPFNVDLTNPTVTGLTLSPTSQAPGQTITASYTCSDPLHGGVASGLASCGKNLSLGGATGPLALMETFTVPTNVIGPQTYSVTATDVAGNSFTAKANYSAIYQFLGFFAPVSNPGTGAQPVINTIKAGQTVPVKWQVLGGNGVGVAGLTLAPTGTVVLAAANSMVCINDTVDNSVSVVASGNSGLQDLGGGNYQFNWKANLPSGACVQLSVNPGDGTTHIAYFQTK